MDNRLRNTGVQSEVPISMSIRYIENRAVLPRSIKSGRLDFDDHKLHCNYYFLPTSFLRRYAHASNKKLILPVRDDKNLRYIISVTTLTDNERIKSLVRYGHISRSSVR